MPDVFSIVNKIDIDVLDRKITAWSNTHNYNPIILMSPDTLKEITTLKDLGIYITKKAHLTYEGIKVFSDPSMKYGEVELR